MVVKINGILQDLKPIFTMIALVFGALASFAAVSDMIPAIKQIASLPGAAWEYAVVAASLALTAGKTP